MDDLATWLRGVLDDLAASHLKTVRAEALADLRSHTLPQDNDGHWVDHGPAMDDWAARERRTDPDGFWAFHDAHSRVLDLWHDARLDTPLADEMLKAVSLAYQHADGYREEWRPQ